MMKLRVAAVAFVVLGAVVWMNLRSPDNAQAGFTVCSAGAFGSSFTYGVTSACSSPAAMALTGSLNKYTEPPGNYVFLKSTSGGCALCNFAEATDGNGYGSGYYLVLGTAYAVNQDGADYDTPYAYFYVS